MNEDSHDFSYPVAADRLGGAVKRFDLTASPEERAALARRFKILGVQKLVAEVELKTLGKPTLVGLKGRFVADVTQACVVSLEPVAQHIEDSFELVFSADELEDGQEIVIEADDADPPDPIVDGVIDIGAAVAEHLALALDPFPRAEGAVFNAPETPEEAPEAPRNPFAALAALKKSGE